MIAADRELLLAELVRLSDACPEMRLGQLVANLATLARGPAPEAVWDAEDSELLEAARQQRRYFEETRRGVAHAAEVAAGAA